MDLSIGACIHILLVHDVFKAENWSRGCHQWCRVQIKKTGATTFSATMWKVGNTTATPMFMSVWLESGLQAA